MNNKLIENRQIFSSFRDMGVEKNAEGWQYGEKRDDVRKLHPCLVAYEDLPESEKEYDRNTEMGTLKVIGQLGFYKFRNGISNGKI